MSDTVLKSKYVEGYGLIEIAKSQVAGEYKLLVGGRVVESGVTDINYLQRQYEKY